MLLSRTVVVVTIASIRRAECRILACERCDRTADAPFSQALATLGIAPEGADFFMCEPAHCPACGAKILEHTLTELV